MKCKKCQQTVPDLGSLSVGKEWRCICVEREYLLFEFIEFLEKRTIDNYQSLRMKRLALDFLQYYQPERLNPETCNA
jgi:hypothetical protein